jgi:hypothetical protein
MSKSHLMKQCIISTLEADETITGNEKFAFKLYANLYFHTSERLMFLFCVCCFSNSDTNPMFRLHGKRLRRQ